MADPTKYVPAYSYSGWQATNPTRPLPADEVDNDFANIQRTTNELVDAVKDVRRSDGKLANQSVGPDQLSPALTIGFTFTGLWVDGRSYSAGDGVVKDDTFYSAKVAHTADVSNAPGNDAYWNELYSLNDIVVTGGMALPRDSFVGDGTTTAFTLSFVPLSKFNLFVQVGGVVQATDAYSSNGNTLTFASPPPNGYGIEVRGFATTAALVTPEDGSVSTEKLADGAVTDAKLAAPANITYLNQTHTTLYFYGGDVVEMFAVSPAREFSIGAGNIEFDEAFSVPSGSQLKVEYGATFVPTFEPVGAARATPLIDLNGVHANYLRIHLEAGINTIRKGFRLGDNCQVGYVECTSSDLNNNRTEAGSIDLISGAVLIDGDHVRIGQLFLNRFDAGWAVVDSTDVIVGKIRNLETVRGGYVHGTRDLHVWAGYTTGPINPNEPNSFVNGRGIMTPGANSLLLGGCSDSSFSNWQAFDTLEHAIRVGQMAASTTVPNHRLSFNNLKLHRPYGCGFKCDDADDFNIKRVSVNGIYTEDVGHDNWFGNPGYQNWASGSVNNPASDNDGNKVALAIRNSQHVTFSDFSNKANAYANSGFFGLWIERSNYVQGSNIDTEKARHDGVVVQSGGSTSPERIELRGVATRENTDSGLLFDATASNANWRDVQVVGLDSQNNGGYGVEVTARQDGASPYATLASRIEGFVRGNAAGQVSIDANVAADADFVNEIRERGTFTPTAAFAVVGTSTWAYSTQSGRYWVEGDRCFVEISLAMTPTMGTGSGNLRIGGLPYASNGGINNINLIETDADFSSWNSRVELVPTVQNGQTFIEIRGLAPAVGTSPIGAANMTPGAEHVVRLAGWYRI